VFFLKFREKPEERAHQIQKRREMVKKIRGKESVADENHQQSTVSSIFDS
jgi:hypothetical protein